MAEEIKPKYLEDVNRYQYADVAARFASREEDAHFVPSALEKLVAGFNLDADLVEGLKAGTFASEEGINTAVGIYAGKYKKALGEMKVSEFYDVRYSTLKSLLGEEKANSAKETFAKYQDTVGSIRKKVEQANAIIKDKTGLFDDKKKEEAKKTVDKLGPIYSIIATLEDRKFEELRADATKQVYKETIAELLKKA